MIDWRKSVSKKPQPPISPFDCGHNEGTYPQGYDQDGRTGYHQRCNRCHIILRTDEPR